MPRRPFARVGEHGFDLVVSTGLNASASGPFGLYTGASLVVRKPDGTESSHVAVTADASTGDFFWTVAPLFLDQAGEYQVILEFTFASAFLASDVETFTVGTRFSAS